jgi:hypothetical protein
LVGFMSTPRQPREARSSTAHTTDRQERPPHGDKTPTAWPRTAPCDRQHRRLSRERTRNGRVGDQPRIDRNPRLGGPARNLTSGALARRWAVDRLRRSIDAVTSQPPKISTSRPRREAAECRMCLSAGVRSLSLRALSGCLAPARCKRDIVAGLTSSDERPRRGYSPAAPSRAVFFQSPNYATLRT